MLPQQFLDSGLDGFFEERSILHTLPRADRIFCGINDRMVANQADPRIGRPTVYCEIGCHVFTTVT